MTTRLPRAPQSPTPEPEIAAALRASLGDVTEAARALGVDVRWVRQMLRTFPELWPADPVGVRPAPTPSPRAGRARGRYARRKAPRPPAPLPPGISGDAVTQTLRRLLGSIVDAAHALGVEYGQMQWIITAHPDLWPDDVPRGGTAWTRGRRALIPSAVLRAVLIEQEGGIIETARILDLAPSVVAARIAAEPELVPPGVTVRRARGGRPLPSR